jgi:hypothetical protein
MNVLVRSWQGIFSKLVICCVRRRTGITTSDDIDVGVSEGRQPFSLASENSNRASPAVAWDSTTDTYTEPRDLHKISDHLQGFRFEI